MIELPKDFKLISEFVAGSILYGTNTPKSDKDVRGVFIPSEPYFLGFLNRTEQFEDKQNDIVFHDIRKFLKLALDNNPNIIEYLFIPQNLYSTITKEWEIILSHAKYFLSTKCRYTFMGYAHSQLNRIKGHRSWLLNPPKKKPERLDFGLIGNRSNLTKTEIGAFNELIALYLEQIGQYHELKNGLEEMNECHTYRSIVKNSTNVDYTAIRNIAPISENILHELEKEKAYRQSMRYWKQYNNWKKTRNPERAKLEKLYGYDVKHAMHLYRLGYQCEELLTKGKITFPLQSKDHLLDIRNGAYRYEQVIEDFEKMEAKMETLYEKSILPKKPNRKKIDELCIKITREKVLLDLIITGLIKTER